MMEHKETLYCPFCCQRHDVVIRKFYERGAMHGITFEFMQAISICTINQCTFYTSEQEQYNNEEFQKSWNKTFKSCKYKCESQVLKTTLEEIRKEYLECIAKIERGEQMNKG